MTEAPPRADNTNVGSQEKRTSMVGQAIGEMALAANKQVQNVTTVEKLRHLLHHASKHTAYYGARLSSVHIGSIRSERDFSELVPVSDLEDMEASRARNGDPFSGRRSSAPPTADAAKHKDAPIGRASQPDRVGRLGNLPYESDDFRGILAVTTRQLLFQLENDGEYALYIALGRGELRSYARALEHCWRLLGMKKGDKAAIFDFGSSPLSYLASGSFLPYVSRGAADGLGCIPVCNDGVSQMSQRAVEIARLIKPRVFFIRSDCVFPFAQEAEKQSVSLKDCIGSVVVAENENSPSSRSCQVWADALGVPVYRLVRVDAAMFLALECPLCGLLHVPGDLYFAEAAVPLRNGRPGYGEGGQLTITNLFARLTPSIRYQCPMRVAPADTGCPAAPKDMRFKLL